MLSNNDLQKIKVIVREEVKVGLKTQLKPVKKHLKKIDNNIQSLLRLHNFNDKRIDVHEKRIKRVENHLNLQTFAS